MNKVRVIDILNKIANGEEVKFKFLDSDDDDIFEVENGHLRNSTCGIFLETQIDHYNYDNIGYGFLNQEVEIIEEDKKIEKLQDRARFQYSQIPNWLDKKEIIDTINENFEKHQKAIYEIIDYLNKEK